MLERLSGMLLPMALSAPLTSLTGWFTWKLKCGTRRYDVVNRLSNAWRRETETRCSRRRAVTS
jgi:hypothetical protein